MSDVYKANQLLFFIGGSIVAVVAYICHLLGMICGFLDLARNLFHFYLILWAVSIFLFLLTALLLKFTYIPIRIFLAFFFAGMFLAIRLFVVNVNVMSSNHIIIRSPPSPFPLDGVFIAFLSIWTVLEWMHLILLQRKLVATRRLRILLNLQIVGLILVLIFAGIIEVLSVLNIIPRIMCIIISFTGIPLSLFICGVPYIVKPDLAYVLIAKARAILIMTSAGLRVYSEISDKSLHKFIDLIPGFISAISQFGHEVFAGAGKLTSISFENLRLLLMFTSNLIICLMVDRPLSLHFTLLKRINSELTKIEIPEVITDEDARKVKKILDPYLRVLLGRLA